MPTTLDPQCAPGEHSGFRVALDVSAAAIARASRIFRALGDPPRLRLLALLARGELCVTEVAMAENEEVSTISQRLRILRNENLVSRRRQGKHIVYGLADQHVADLVFNALAHAAEPHLAAAPRNPVETTPPKGVYVPPDSHRK
jgi:ArsR family transcriptional regulator